MILNSSIRTSFGQKNGRIVSLDEVDSGLNCDCFCPECGSVLVAKKGNKNAWHFAHHQNVANQSCVETAIHAAAKQLLLEANWLRAPSKEISVRGRTISGRVHSKHEVLAQEKIIRFDRCQAEVWETNLRPDVVGYRGERRMLIEMYFTHQVDDEKRAKLQEQGLPAIEIDLSDLEISASFDTLRQRVLEDVEYKEWLFFPGEIEAKSRLKEALEYELAALTAQETFVQNRRKQKEDALLKQKQKVEAAISEANERYRQLPRSEKELLLRDSLDIKGKWPYFLQKVSQETSAICEPPQIWQAALFARFIFGKAESQAKIEIDTLYDWLAGRFGIIEGEGAKAKTALRMYLGYLAACGFLKKPYTAYGSMYYTVRHDTLIPPAKTEKPILPQAIVNATPFHSPLLINHKTKVQWMWKASWPERDKMLEQAKLSFKEPVGASIIMMALQGLNRHNKPKTPDIFADEMQTYGIASEVTLQLLIDVGLALKHMR